MRLAVDLLNLEEVTVIVDSSVTQSQSDVMEFVRRCRHLRKLLLEHTNNKLSRRFDTEIDGVFDVKLLWDEAKQKGSITIERKFFD